MYQNKKTRLFVENIREIRRKKKTLVLTLILYILWEAYILKNKYHEVLDALILLKNLYHHYENNKKGQNKQKFMEIKKFFKHFKKTNIKILIRFFSQLQIKIYTLCTRKKVKANIKQLDCNSKQVMLRDNICLGVTKYFLVIYTLTFLRCFLKVKIFIIGRHVFAEERKKKKLYKYRGISFDISKKSFKFLLCSFSLWKNTKLFELKEVFYQRFRTSITKVSLHEKISFNDIKRLFTKCKLCFNIWLFRDNHFDLFILEILQNNRIKLQDLEFLEMYGEVRIILMLLTFKRILMCVLEKTFLDFEILIHHNFQSKKINFSKVPFFLQYSCHLPIQISHLINILSPVVKLQKYSEIIFFLK